MRRSAAENGPQAVEGKIPSLRGQISLDYDAAGAVAVRIRRERHPQGAAADGIAQN